jgi:hypothetical protein
LIKNLNAPFHNDAGGSDPASNPTWTFNTRQLDEENEEDPQ